MKTASRDPGSPPAASQWRIYYQTDEATNAPAVWSNGTIMNGLNVSGWPQLITLHAWHKFACTCDCAGTTRAYIDGNLVSQSATAPTYDPTTPWTLTLGNFDGDIDEVRISTALRVNPESSCPEQQQTCP